MLGIPAYGRSLLKPENVKTYSELVGMMSDFDPAQDQVDGFYFNGQTTAKAKAEYARAQGLQGVMLWEAGQDVSEASGVEPSSTESKSLLDAIGSVLRPQPQSLGIATDGGSGGGEL